MRVHQLTTALRYAWDAKTIYDVHAPLAFAYLGEVVEDTRHFYAYDLIESARAQLLANRRTIKLEDHGAGSLAAAATTKSLSLIAKNSASPPAFGRYLAATVDWLGARRVLELGTNVGIGTAYLASALPRDGHLVSIDADAALLEVAKSTLAAVPDAKRVDLVHGTFADRLAGALADLGQVDLAFIDGHHERDATQRYFAQIAGHTHDQSVVILDDVHWSPGMEEAWDWVKSRPGVTLSIDLYRWGVVFFDPRVLSPKHLTIVPKRYKPWHMGFFSSRAT